MKKCRFFVLTAAISSMSPSLLAATMTIFDDDAVRSTDIELKPALEMTVFTGEGAHKATASPTLTPMPALTLTLMPMLPPRNNGWISLSTGYREDDMRFSIGGKGFPNVLSELTWRVPAMQIRTDLGWAHESGAVLKGYLAYARSFSDGRVRDADYALNNRQAEFSRSYSDATGSEMFDLSLGTGWRLPLGEMAAVTPLLGVSHHQATYRMSNGRQIISDKNNALLLGINDWNVPLGSFNGLHSRYRPVWNSMWFGLDGELKAGKHLSLHAGIKHHWFRYRAKADWNLRNDLAHPISFLHKDSGKGWEIDVGAALRLSKKDHLTLDLSRREMKTREGQDTTYAANGANSTITLGESVGKSWAVQVGYRREF